ncbi:hypothetical protein JRO89_XS04G0163600 [Xanthoceras sorbifolium]|uniref:Prefoldin subunit 4 n=1 Tax=Xanthoceras sorbifolium TaxID=99658 RepID=A0ABQ8I5J3_9ROSI|nr:hypothetical protein JRO89_XS04G0163600 [Xanthoceras sorbifolium]
MFLCEKKGGKSDTEVTWEDQQNINKFGRLNNRLHELEDEIKIAKFLGMFGKGIVNKLIGEIRDCLTLSFNLSARIATFLEFAILAIFHHSLTAVISSQQDLGETNDNLEDASNELILTDEEVVRFQIGEVFAHVPKDEVENRIEEMKEATDKNLEKLEEEKETILTQMAELKKILYGKFKDSINLEED